MPDWFALSELKEISLGEMVFRLLLASICGQCIAWISLLKTDKTTNRSISMTFVLMCILIAMATQIIGSNIARAFSLVGALSIVRFRTAITSTQDVSLVLASVVVGMAVGAGQYLLVCLGLVTLAVVSWILRSLHQSSVVKLDDYWLLSIRATLSGELDLSTILAVPFESIDLISAQTARKGSAVEYEYRVLPRPGCSVIEVLTTLSSHSQLENISIRCDSK